MRGKLAGGSRLVYDADGVAEEDESESYAADPSFMGNPRLAAADRWLEGEGITYSGNTVAGALCTMVYAYSTPIPYGP